ncbi:MAG: NADH-quinone oxidoreductase subunit M [Chloroflexi bacterium]|nr:NADH-quinone oxidoreductase subunit M [Chloroflexota bacterium]MBA3780095.1 NADH-quinone oxidoreductase subunit M [Chloroflexota bacterium]HEV8053288.1 NADH-quinone oxidoreductase subunit M [Candidatus Limnocylindrales bacterium]
MTVPETAAADQAGFPILSLLVFLPMIGGLILLLLPAGLARRAAIVLATLELGLSVLLVLLFRPEVPGMQLAERVAWVPSAGIGYHVGVDGISVLFIPIVCLLTLAVLLSASSALQAMTTLALSALLVLEATIVGVFVAVDLALFFIFWEAMLVPTYLLIRLSGIGRERQEVAARYVMYMLVGSAPLLIGIVLLGINHQQVTGGSAGGRYSFDVIDLLAVPVSMDLQLVVLGLFAFAFAVKGPLVPFHSWLPSTLLHGPAGLGVFLLGFKVGLYGFLRVGLPLVPDAAREFAWALAAVGLLGLLYGALIAIAQTNIRRMLAFAGISHVGLAALGISAMSAQGVQGALLLMVNLGLATTGLLLVSGFLYARMGTTDAGGLGTGLARSVPRLAIVCFILGLASIGVPGTSGFPGELLIMLGAFRAHGALGLMAVVGVVLSAMAFLAMFERTFLGPERRTVPPLPDLRPRELAVGVVLSVAVLLVGIFPGPLLDRTELAVDAFVQRINEGAVP